MLAVAFFRWWYGQGWHDNAARLRTCLISTYLEFSVPMLARTMFSPWRRIISYGGGSLGERARVALDNLISRMVGLGVRLSALAAAILIMGLNGILGGLWLLLWPLLPIAGPLLIVWGLLR